MQVAGKLKSTLLGNAGAAAGSREFKPDAPPSGNVAAYNALLQGNFYLERRTDEDLRKAIDLYQQAARLDAGYALAYAKLTYARMDLEASFTPAAGDARTALQAEVRDALAKALELDPESPDVHLAQGLAMELLDFDLAGAGAEYRRAAKLAPQNSLVAMRLALVQSYSGDFEAAVAGYRRMLALDPLSARGHQYLGMTLAKLGRYAEAEATLREGIELQPQAAVQRAYLACVQVVEGRGAEALATAQQEPDEFWRNWALAFAQDANGNRAASDQALDWLITHDAEDGASQIAQVYAWRKQPDETFKWLDHAYESHDGGLQQMRLSLFLAAYENDPRYLAIARKVRVLSDPDASARGP
jgi:serine/threonine-protein kinase